MAEIVFMHHDKNGARQIMRHNTATMTAEYKAMEAARAFIKWNEQNPDAPQKEVLHRFIDLPELAQERLGAAIAAEYKRRGLA